MYRLTAETVGLNLFLSENGLCKIHNIYKVLSVCGTTAKDAAVTYELVCVFQIGEPSEDPKDLFRRHV